MVIWLRLFRDNHGFRLNRVLTTGLDQDVWPGLLSTYKLSSPFLCSKHYDDHNWNCIVPISDLVLPGTASASQRKKDSLTKEER